MSSRRENEAARDGLEAGFSGGTRCGEEIPSTSSGQALRQAQDDDAVGGRLRVSGVILAAGFSRRLGRPKQLLELGGKPLLQWAIDAALAAGLSEVLVVLGESAAAILEHVDLGTARLVINPDAIDGQSTSIMAGVAVANPERVGTLFMLGDQPDISAADLDLVLQKFEGTPDEIVIASWQGERRSPVVFGRSYDGELLRLRGDTGARPILRAHSEQVVAVEFDRPVPIDIDTEADYQRLLQDRNAAERSE
jgi:molybdenum cofactor cytidylyltransferase